VTISEISLARVPSATSSSSIWLWIAHCVPLPTYPVFGAISELKRRWRNEGNVNIQGGFLTSFRKSNERARSDFHFFTASVCTELAKLVSETIEPSPSVELERVERSRTIDGQPSDVVHLSKGVREGNGPQLNSSDGGYLRTLNSWRQCLLRRPTRRGLSRTGKNKSATIRNPRATERNGDSARSSASC
jgi:hypothetical protein